MRYLLTILCACCMVLPTLAYGQHTKANPYNYDFVPGENVVFYDDFSGYREGAFPDRWMILDTNEKFHFDMHTKAAVAKKDSLWCLYFSLGNGNYAMPHWDTAGYSAQYKNNYWSIEFDFRLYTEKNNSSNDIGINISDFPRSYWYIEFARYWGQRDSEVYSMGAWSNRGQDDKQYGKHYPTEYNTKIWHHFAVAITQHGTYGYVDRCKLISMPYFDFYLPSLKFDGRGKVAIRNFRMARTDSLYRKVDEASVPVSSLLTEHKFVTHAILFDKNKAVIKPESMPLIKELAGVLKANMGIKLEIDGHTDSDGTPDANLLLSNNRAAAIKKQLVQMGVAADRLKTKGFGAMQPIANNMNEDGKAMNRRVEFVRL